MNTTFFGYWGLILSQLKTEIMSSDDFAGAWSIPSTMSIRLSQDAVKLCGTKYQTGFQVLYDVVEIINFSISGFDSFLNSTFH